MQLYQNKSSYPKENAQQNLMGRTHYVDDDTLRFHKSKVLATAITDGGLLFAIVTKDALDYENKRRGYRYVIFDVFGTVLRRTKLEEAFASKERALKAMWQALGETNARQATLNGIERAERHHGEEMAQLRKEIDVPFRPRQNEGCTGDAVRT